MQIALANQKKKIRKAKVSHLKRLVPKTVVEDLRLPRVVYNREEMLKSLHAIQALKDRGVRIFYGHDPEFWRTVPQAPVPIG